MRRLLDVDMDINIRVNIRVLLSRRFKVLGRVGFRVEGGVDIIVVLQVLNIYHLSLKEEEEDMEMHPHTADNNNNNNNNMGRLLLFIVGILQVGIWEDFFIFR